MYRLLNYVIIKTIIVWEVILMLKFFSILLVSSLLLVGCNRIDVKEVSSDSEITNEISRTKANENDVSPKSEGKEELPTEDTNQFELSQNEEMAYSNFQKDLDLKQLNGLEPISIAKLYLKAGAEKKYDIQYALYTDRTGFIQWSKEEDEKIPESDRGTIKEGLVMFKNLSEGTFKQTSDDEGYIEFESVDGSSVKSGFRMIKNENGVWQVAFLPIQ